MKSKGFLLKGFLIVAAVFVATFSVAQLTNSATVCQPFQGCTGKGTATAGDVGKVLTVSDDSPFTFSFETPSAGATVALDLGNNGSQESTSLTEIATVGDTNSIFSEPSADKLLITLSNDWPKADQADALAANGANCSAGQAPRGVDASGAAENCTVYLTGNETITLSGDISGSGATSITTAIGNDKITEAMLKAVDTANDEDILTYEATGGDFEWHAGADLCVAITGSADLCDGSDDGGAGGSNWNDIGDATADGAIALGGFETDFTSSLDAAGKAVWTITNTDADTANDTDFISLVHNDGADANVFYLRAVGDNDGTPVTDYAFSQTAATFGVPISVATINLTGTGTLNGLDAIDATTEDFLEGAIDIAGDVDGTGLTAVDLDEVAVETELEGVLDLDQLQGAVTDGQVPDTITVNLATLATTVTVADTTDSTSFCGLFESATGSLGAKTDLGCTYDATTGTLSATVLSSDTLTLTGTGTINGLDAVDATSETTIESAIDTLANLTSVQSRTITLADAGADVVWGWDDSANAYENLTAAEVEDIIEAADGSGSGLDADLLDGKSTGTSGNVVPLLDGTNTWSGAQTISLGSAATTEPFRVVNTNDNASVQVVQYEGDRATMAANDEGYLSFMLSDSAGNQDEQARLTFKATTVTSGATQDGQLIFSTLLNNSLTTILTLGGADSSATFAGNLSIGTSNAFTAGTIELGAASDTTLARSGAGDVTIEGNAIYRAGGTDVVVADGGTGAGTFTDAGVIIGNGTGALQVTSAGTAGQVLTSNGAGVDPTFQAVSAPTATTTVINFYTSSSTWTKPAGLKYIIVEVVGGGGGGGGNTTNTFGSGGGGGGGYSREIISAATASTTEAVTVGNAGAAGTGVGGAGGTGGTSSFGNTPYLQATGGVGGAADGGGGTATSKGGLGGIGSNGTINTAGGAGTGAGNANEPAGSGGGSTYGGGGEGRNTNGAGIDGQLCGGGGGGAWSTGGDQTGGVGAKGCVIVTEYY